MNQQDVIAFFDRLATGWDADMIRDGIPMNERLKKLRHVAYYQMQSITKNKSIEQIKA